MKLHPKLVLGVAVLAMGLLPTMAGAVSYQPEYHPDTGRATKASSDE